MKAKSVKLFLVLLAGLVVLSACRPKELESTVMALQRQSYDDALGYAQEAVKAYPGNAEAWFYLGYVHSEHTKDYAQMNMAFDKVMELNPAQKVSFGGGNAPAQDAVNQIRSSKFADNYNSGVKTINTAVAKTDDESAQMKLFTQARDKLQLATEIAPDRTEPLTPLARMHLVMGDTAKAEAIAQKILSSGTQDEALMTAAGEVYMLSGNTEKSEETFLAVQKLNPNNVDIIQKLAQLATTRSDWEQANRYYSQALAAEPDNTDLAYNIGVSYYNQGKTDEAIQYFEKALEAEGDSEVTYNILANCYARTDTKMDEGVLFLEKATKVFPENATFYEYLAILYGKKGMAEESNAAFKKSQELKK